MNPNRPSVVSSLVLSASVAREYNDYPDKVFVDTRKLTHDEEKLVRRSIRQALKKIGNIDHSVVDDLEKALRKVS